MAKSSKSAAGSKGSQAKAASSRSASSGRSSASSSSRSAAASRGAAGKTAAAARGGASSSRSNGSTTSRSNGNGRSASKGPSFDERTLLNELFVEELKDIYWAEKHLTKALPKMAKAATSPELTDAFNTHLEQTQEQIGRVEQVFEILGMPARAKKCEAMSGLVEEAQQGIEDTPKGSSVRDAALIICAQKVEHYEIAAYGSLVQLAKTIGQNEIANLLAETLSEEKETDQILTELAETGINISASQESE
ncbi:ferritin-like domain-containing protein [Flaviaesturariibacter flavus]|uniref:Ferritin-like domain-containing protein n=1 Tax=Flaviaesturariibacter flavus TaxID=2502780 RepID=A0A4V2NWL2_9BACT|nr:ferritin-like domain-containing protein [Flaviaesturariibacter flavus]TCJ17812.1 ferritin-like domain-containing protein [Flaviaesturariibacter flavus]